MTTFIRLLDVPVDAKPAALKAAVTGVGPVFECAPEAFAAVPGSPFAYWVSEAVRETFSRYPRLDHQYTATRGAYTTDDFKYYRLKWEVPGGARAKTREETLGSLAYVPLAKGGSFSPYYSDIHLIVRWHDDGAEPKAFLSAYRERKGWGTDWSACLNGYSHYFRPGLTWPLRTTSGFGIRALPAGCIFGHKGPVAFLAGDDPQDLLALSALMNSGTFGYLLGVQLAAADAAARSYEVGLVQRTPIPDLTPPDRAALAALARRAWSLRRALDTVTETSHAFVLPPGLNERVTGLDPAAIAQELAGLQREIDERAFAGYGIGPEDRAAILASATPSERRDHDDDAADAAAEDPGDDGELDDPADLASGDLGGERSWLVGVVFGRFDPRLATGERPIPPEPEPFDPLPARSPGMVPEGEEPADRPDVLVDDPGHRDDLAARAQAVAERVQVEVPENLRGWLAREFFPLHIRMYSKSRRKAPIYWQLATPSGSYSVWLYLHAFSKDTLFRVQNDYVAPKLAHEERRLALLTNELRDGGTAAQRKDLATHEALVEDLRAFLAEVKRVAPLWHPNLDDGVIVNFAPLWRLVPQHKAWQKELKTTWDALREGKYDWAHLAMHLWPERVVPKCATDRSLAIAHGLEADFWEQDDDGKWRARAQGAGFSVQAVVDALVRERTSAAVKEALKALLEAPAPVAARGGGRKPSASVATRRSRSTPRSPAATPVAPEPATLEAVRQAIAAGSEGVSKSDVLTATGLTVAQWNSAIASLLASGVVSKSGAGRGTRYRLNPKS